MPSWPPLRKSQTPSPGSPNASREGGRLIYVGAGTAAGSAFSTRPRPGRPFDVPEGLVLAVFAGGSDAMACPAKGPRMTARLPSSISAPWAARLETPWSGSRRAAGRLSLSARSLTLGAVGALTVGVVCNRHSAVARAAELAIELLVGSEVVAGSTRLNAGTAQKITLNILSTAVMIQLGKTYGNLMVDVRATNEKLRDRAIRIVATVAKTTPELARAALEACGGERSPLASSPPRTWTPNRRPRCWRRAVEGCAYALRGGPHKPSHVCDQARSTVGEPTPARGLRLPPA